MNLSRSNGLRYGSLCVLAALLSGCTFFDPDGADVEENLLENPEYAGLPPTEPDPEPDAGEDVPISTSPESEGEPLFVRNADPGQNIAGFEFCCGQYDTYQEHEFANATGDFIKLDGGFWGAEIDGTLGERVFSSYGDGYDDESDSSAAQLGPKATGMIDSPSFVISGDYINFLIGGGANRFDAANATAVVLLIDGVVVRQAHGLNQDRLIAWTSWDVKDLAGQTAVIRFIDFHPGDGSDAAVPYILADQFRAADKAAVVPPADSRVPAEALELSGTPEFEGEPAFVRQADPAQDIAAFEFCCGGFNTYQEHEFLASGDFIRFDGGQWAADIGNKLGDRVFASYGQGFAGDADNSGRWYGWEATGTLTTPEFVIDAPYLNFLIGGGTNAYDSERATAIVLRVNGKIVRQAVGNGQEAALSWASWDLSGLEDQTAVIEIIDRHDNAEEDGSYPFILVDHIRQAQRAAAAPAADSVVSMAFGHDQSLLLDLGDPNPYYEDGEFYVYYLQNRGYHSWSLARTSDLLHCSFPQEVLPASGDPARQDRWVGSGSVLKDQEGQYHLFYTGHNSSISPVEAVMHATAADGTLVNWEADPGDTFTGSGGYSDFDFRDPLVFWNEAAGTYWMLLTSRYASQAAIGLYTSDDLSEWTPQAPLYTENSPLNLEVPDYFSLDGMPFIVYSDQREESRQVKYLMPGGASWTRPDYEALDGRAYYAARSAGPAGERLLFGWVAHNDGRTDEGSPEWGGNLVVHQLGQVDGQLAVSLPQRLRDGLAAAQSTEPAWTEGGVGGGGGGSLTLDAGAAFTLDAFGNRNRLSFGASSGNAESVFGIRLRPVVEGGVDAYVEIDAANDRAEFYFDGEKGRASNPVVNVPLDLVQGVDIEVMLDPTAGVGTVYMNGFRALSFRLYALADYQVGVYAASGGLSLEGLSRYAQ